MNINFKLLGQRTFDEYGSVYHKLKFIVKDIEKNRVKDNKEEVELLLLNNDKILKEAYVNTKE